MQFFTRKTANLSAKPQIKNAEEHPAFRKFPHNPIRVREFAEGAEPNTQIFTRDRTTDKLAVDRTLGAKRIYRGQVYTFKGVQPHTTRDGREIELDCWSTGCPCCGARFETRTSQTQSPWYPARRCIACAKGGRYE